MNKRTTLKAITFTVALALVSVTHIALGSFTGSSEGRAKQFSLKDFNKSFYKTNAVQFSLRSFEFKGSQVLNKKKENDGSTTVSSIMRFEKGNTTYIYPYKHKISVPKFATPTPPTIR
ncbi:hypothetical protein [Aridibaculum aurantiacum]|uniref:hypothetical protein n=1 Tax=Aridibaculum aurantiacum TaxID=2810307 RepID=UPI001A957DD4|nr:hypothetical protein [Aridibaculum aurantiacum]